MEILQSAEYHGIIEIEGIFSRKGGEKMLLVILAIVAIIILIRYKILGKVIKWLLLLALGLWLLGLVVSGNADSAGYLVGGAAMIAAGIAILKFIRML